MFTLGGPSGRISSREKRPLLWEVEPRLSNREEWLTSLPPAKHREIAPTWEPVTVSVETVLLRSVPGS